MSKSNKKAKEKLIELYRCGMLYRETTFKKRP